MLNALRRLGRSVPLAELSAATLAAGAQSVTITPTLTNLSVVQTLKHSATIPSVINRTPFWRVNGGKGVNSTISIPLQNYSLLAQNPRSWPFPRTPRFTSTTAIASAGRVQASPKCKASTIEASLPSTSFGTLVQPAKGDGCNANNLATGPTPLFSQSARPGSSKVLFPKGRSQHRVCNPTLVGP